MLRPIVVVMFCAAAWSLLRPVFQGIRAHGGISGMLSDFSRPRFSHLPTRVIVWRGIIFFGWMVGFLCSMALIGLIPTVPLFIIAWVPVLRDDVPSL
jgi:hypothetical protein